jgi:hypothetical protein
METRGGILKWTPPLMAQVTSVPKPPHYRGFTITITPNSVGILWTSDQPQAEASTWRHTTFKRDAYMTREEFEPAIPARKYKSCKLQSRRSADAGSILHNQTQLVSDSSWYEFLVVHCFITNHMHLFIKNYHHSHLKLHTLRMSMMHN